MSSGLVGSSIHAGVNSASCFIQLTAITSALQTRDVADREPGRGGPLLISTPDQLIAMATATWPAFAGRRWGCAAVGVDVERHQI
jgi:hypothetical protein